MGSKDTVGKPKLGLVPFSALAEISKVREYGISKYGDDECWREVEVKDFLDATLRHIYKFLYESETDEESGLPHLSHAACSMVLGLSNYIEQRKEFDMDLQESLVGVLNGNTTEYKFGTGECIDVLKSKSDFGNIHDTNSYDTGIIGDGFSG